MTNHNQFRGFTFIVGIDIAKSVFQAYTCNVQTGEITNEQVKRADLLERFADRGKCLIGMEACGSSQYWARKFQVLGHTVRLMDAKLVKPFVQHNKSDRADAEGIFNAVMQGVREVAVKNETERDLQTMLTMRAKIVEQRTANINHVRGLLAEYRQVIPRSTTQFSKKVDECINALEGDAVQLVINTPRESLSVSHLWGSVQGGTFRFVCQGLSAERSNSDAYVNVILSTKISGMATDKRPAF